MKKDEKEPKPNVQAGSSLGQELLCMVGLHNWTKWEKIAAGDITEYGIGTSVIGYYVRQQRSCTCCGEIKMKDRKTY